MDELSRLRERVAELEADIRKRDERVDLVADRLPKLLCFRCLVSVEGFLKDVRALPPSEKERR